MVRKEKILIIDDEEKMCRLLKDILEVEKFNVEYALNGSDGIERLKKEDFDLLILDLRLPDMDGISLLKKIRDKGIPVIMISAYGNIPMVVEAMKYGAEDFIEKPFEKDRIIITIKNVLNRKRIEEERDSLKKEALERFKIIGVSDEIMRIKELIKKCAKNDYNVLITGETGTGKELVARNIHYLSERSKGNFVKVNCSAIPDTLIESELFGYEKGAFTGAYNTKKGYFELANNGTLFLDEIGDMPLNAQAKILSAIEEKEIFHIGGTTPIGVNTRIISATNQDLDRLIKDKKFREDLYYRLNVFYIHIPALRERKEDIPVLAQYFLDMACVEVNTEFKHIRKDGMEYLKTLEWKGNVRELKHIMEKAAIIIEDTEITKDALMDIFISENNTLNRSVKCEKEEIIEALEKSRWKIDKASKILGIHRSTLFRKMKKYGINFEGENEQE